MIALPSRENKLLVAMHGWMGIVLGVLLYAVVLTGMLAVFAHEIGTWSSGTLETASPFERPVDATVRTLSARTPARYHDELYAFATDTNRLGLFFHTHETAADGAVFERGVLWEVERDGRVAARREGTDEEVFGPDNPGALGRFLIDLHVRLHLPNPWGLLLTGILGLVMLAAAISGLLIHRHLFKDIFTLRRWRGGVLAARDRHNVAGSWSLPFAFILAFTGSFFSFAGSFGLPAIAMVAFGGDQTRMFETLVGTSPAVDARPATGANLDRVIASATRRAGAIPDYISIGHLGRADAAITTSHPPREGTLESVTLVHDGATGAFRTAKPVLGTKASFGATLYALMIPLHFGQFAGILSRAVWFALGFAVCYVAATGMRLWLRRREADRPALRWLDRTVTVVVQGLPLAIAVSAIGYFLARPAGDAVYWVPASFLIAAGAAIVAGIAMKDGERFDALLRGTIGLVLPALPLLRLATGGPGWGEALAAGQPTIVAGDLAMATAGIVMLASLRSARAAPRPVPVPAILQAAE
jgi:uncharacterized iron-regulated membrane protein